jgi:hypothetical protein
MNIVIEIDELVLHGFPPGDRYRIGEAVQAELARIFAERGLPDAWRGGGAAARLDGGSFDARRPGEAVGGGIANAVMSALAAAQPGDGAGR